MIRSRSFRRRPGLALARGAVVASLALGLVACGEGDRTGAAPRADASTGSDATGNRATTGGPGGGGQGGAAPRADASTGSDATGNGATTRGSTGDGPSRAPARPRARAEDPLARWSGRGFAVATVARGRSVLLRRSPGGRALTRVGSRTEFGSPRTFAVQARRGPWLGVAVAERPNGRLAWVDGRSRRLVAAQTTWSLRADLSARRLEVRREGRLVRRFRVAIGRAGHPTPTGRFAVTDKIDARRYGGTYGCCIVALTGHQPVLPAGWPGGDRLALHGTTATGSVGSAASTGCLRARDSDLRPLMRRLPLGTPLIVRA